MYAVKSEPHSVKRSLAAICYESNRQIYDSFTVSMTYQSLLAPTY
jgi:hypothetical protein